MVKRRELPFLDALKLYDRGVRIICEYKHPIRRNYTTEYEKWENQLGKNVDLRDTWSDPITSEEILYGKWYIEEVEDE